MKRLFFLLAIVFVFFTSISVYAAPEEFSSDATGTVDDLIILSDFVGNVDNSVSTFDTPYIISGSGQEDVTVTLYIYNDEFNLYQKIKIKKVSLGTNNTVIEYDLSFDVGASGLFMTDINLKDGKNKIALYAEKDKKDIYQIEKININKLNKSFKAFIENLKVDIKSELLKLIGGESK